MAVLYADRFARWRNVLEVQQDPLSLTYRCRLTWKGHERYFNVDWMVMYQREWADHVDALVNHCIRDIQRIEEVAKALKGI